MEFGVLGPVRVVTSDGSVVDVGGARQRRLLAALVLHASEVAPTDRLLDIVFESDPPDGAQTTIRSYVARLRRSLADAMPDAADLISTVPGGYRLETDETSIDAGVFAAAIEHARRQAEDRDPVGATETLRDALRMWRGDAYGEFAFEDWASPEASRLEELRVVAHEELGDALLASGLANDVVAAARGLVVEHPLRERFRRQHMLALYRAGRQAEALRSFNDHQRELIEVGLEPSSDLASLAQRIAAHDPALHLQAPAGQRLRGYRLGSELGQGAHGVVHRAVQPGVGREVAVKSIRAELADNPEFIRRFDAEAQLMANLEHAHIVPIYDYWREPGGAHIVMRLLADDLGAWLSDGPMDVAAVAELATQLGGALAAAHRAGVVHGDVKPSNILVDESSAYLADFGVATLVESAVPDATASPPSGYESPEILAGGGPSRASDQFALAALFSQLLTGRLPFGTRAFATPHEQAPSVRARRPSVASDVDDVLRHALDRDPIARYPDVDSFVVAFEAALLGRRVADRPDHEPENPYRGLRAFTEADQGLFFGREDVTHELLDHLARPGVDGRFVVAVGASGSGKSSVVRAGLVPRLRAGAIPGSETWSIATMVPGSNPFAEFAATIRSIAVDDPGPPSGTPDDGELSRLLDVALPQGRTLLVVIDQLEELFGPAVDESERRHFIDGLVREMHRTDRDVRVAATLRADHLDRPLRYAELGQLVKGGSVTVLGMSPAQLEMAITQPAAVVGVEVESALATQIVADVLDQPGALPMLQFTLTELFERRTGRLLTLESYQELGGVAAAVANRAESVFDDLDPQDQELARRFFLRLVTVTESRSVTRRRSTRSDVLSVAAASHEAMEGVIDAFRSSRLLSTDHQPDSREPTVEIAHEALIAHWPRFGRWVDEAGEGLHVLAQIADGARRWDENDREEGELFRGVRLATANELASHEPDALNGLEREFVAASEAAQQAELEAERRSQRRVRTLLTAAAALVLVALSAGAVALVQSRRADREADATQAAVADADIADLVRQSASLRTEDPDLSILLALEAHRRVKNPETEQALFDALTSGAPNVVATGSFLPNEEECQFNQSVSDDGTTAYALSEGQLVTQDLLSGEVTVRAAALNDCQFWLGDPESGRVQVVDYYDTTRTWLGTTDDPYRIEVPQLGPHFPTFSNIGSGVAVYALEDRAFALHDADTGEPIGDPIDGGDAIMIDGTARAVVAANGTAVAVNFTHPGTNRGRLHLVDGQTAAPLHDVIDTDAPIVRMEFDVEGEQLTAELENGLVLRIDVDDGQLLGPAVGSTDESDGTLRPDGLLLRTEPNDTYSIIAPEGSALVDRSWAIDPFADVWFHDGRAAALDTAAQQVVVVDLASGERTEYDLGDGPDDFFARVVTPSTDGFWAFSRDGVVARWDGDRLVEVSDLRVPFNGGSRLGDRVALRVASGPNRQEARLLRVHPGGVAELLAVPLENSVAVHPSPEGGIHVMEHLGELRTYDEAGELVSAIDTGAVATPVITVDPTNGVVAIASIGNRSGVVLADPETGAVERLEPEAISTVGFAPGARRLAIVDIEGTVRLWDLDDSRSAGIAWEGTSAPDSSPPWYDEDSDAIWVATSGRLIEIPLDPDRWVERACEVVGRDLTPQEWDRYVPGEELPQSACA